MRPSLKVAPQDWVSSTTSIDSPPCLQTDMCNDLNCMSDILQLLLSQARAGQDLSCESSPSPILHRVTRPNHLAHYWHVLAPSACREHTRSLLSRHFSTSMEEVLTSDRLVFGDYLVPGADPKVYAQVTDMTRLVKVK